MKERPLSAVMVRIEDKSDEEGDKGTTAMRDISTLSHVGKGNENEGRAAGDDVVGCAEYEEVRARRCEGTPCARERSAERI